MIGERLLKSASKALAGDAPAVPSLALAGIPGKRVRARTAEQYAQSYGGLEDAIDWVANCVDLYAQTTSNANFYFHEPQAPGEDNSAAPEAMDNPPEDLSQLLKQPNPYQDYTELMELGIIDFLTCGEFFWLKYKVGTDSADSEFFGKPLGLYRLEPWCVEIVLDEDGRPETVEYQAPGNREKAEFKPEHIVHVKRPNPHDPWRGMSVIAGMPRMFDIELSLTEAVAAYYENGTRPTGVLESDRPVPNTTWEKMKKQFRQLYQGAAAAGSVVMLERGLKFNRMSADASAAEFVNMSELMMRRIARSFKVPLPLLGETASSSDRQAVKEAQRIWDNKVMRPFLNRIQSQISVQLTQAWGVDFYIDYQYIMPIEDKLDLAEALAGLPGITVEEVRSQVDLKPLDQVDGVDTGKTIDNTVLNLPGEDREDGGFPDNVTSGERSRNGGRPANPENTRAFPQGNDKLPAGAAAKKSMSEAEVRKEIRRLRGVLKNGS